MPRIRIALMVMLLPFICNAQTLGLGSAPTVGQLRDWDIDVSPDGAGLPAGLGSVATGRALYAARCAHCHGNQGEGGPQDRLMGGQGTLAGSAPVKTVGSFWPFATTLFDYIRRAMPFDAPQSLRNDEVYALVAFVLHLNAILPENAVLDEKSLPAIRMPNRDGFRSHTDAAPAKN